MVKALLSIAGLLLAVWLIEAVGAALIVYGIYREWGGAAALIAGGVALLLKAFELEQRSAG